MFRCGARCILFPMLLFISGCPAGPSGGGGGNTAPVANAGSDQTVEGGDLVQLDGSASADTDGDALTFSWAQVQGPDVALSDTTTAMPTFIAPSAAGTLIFILTVDDGTTTHSDSVNIEVPVDPNTLFVVNNSDSVASFANAANLEGDVAPTTHLPAGSTTGIFQPRSLAVTPTGILFVTSQNNQIVAYEDGLNVTGEAIVDRSITGGMTLLETPISLAYDSGNDRLFVGNTNSDNGILVFDNVSSRAFDGDYPPDRTFGPDDRAPFDSTVSIKSTFDAMDLDSNGSLYVSDTSGNNVNQSRILVFDNPDTDAAGTEPARIFTSDSWVQIEDIAVTDNDVFLVVDTSESIYIFAGASSLSGDVTPDAVVRVDADQARLEGIVVSSGGTGYVADRQNFAIHIFDNMTTRSGTLPPDRSIVGNASELRNPRQLYLHEPQ